MRALVVYESMFGNTRAVAQAIAAGLGGPAVARAIPVSAAPEEDLSGYDLLVVGGPTHVHGMSRTSTRQAAADTAATATAAGGHGPELDEHADVGTGLREWLGRLQEHPPQGGPRRAAAFDTRADVPALVSGRASRGIARQLEHAGFVLVTKPHSFLVTKEPHLAPHETDRARNWGRDLSSAALKNPQSANQQG
jgi:Flavodoxin domain